MREIRLERKAEAVKYTLEELGEVLGVSVQTALKLETSPERLSYEQAVKVAEWLGCKPSELF